MIDQDQEVALLLVEGDVVQVQEAEEAEGLELLHPEAEDLAVARLEGVVDPEVHHRDVGNVHRLLNRPKLMSICLAEM